MKLKKTVSTGNPAGKTTGMPFVLLPAGKKGAVPEQKASPLPVIPLPESFPTFSSGLHRLYAGRFSTGRRVGANTVLRQTIEITITD